MDFIQAGFQDFHPDLPTMRKTFGSLVLHISMHEYVNMARAIDQKEVETLNSLKSFT